MKKLLKILVLLVIMMVYSTNTLAWVPVVVPHAHHTSHHQDVETDGQEIYKHSIGILIGKEIRGCKIIDAFYWDHKINMICIKENTFYKMRVVVEDMKEEKVEGWTKMYWDVDVTKEVVDIFLGENSGETIQE
jgi:hypothetical protein